MPKLFSIAPQASGIPDTNPFVQGTDYKGWILADTVGGFGAYLFSGTGSQLSALNALSQIIGLCVVTESRNARWAELNNAFPPGVRTRLNTWLSARGYPTIPAGWTTRQVVDVVYKRFNARFDINGMDVSSSWEDELLKSGSGDTVIVPGGTYVISLNNTIPSGVTLKAAPGATVIVQPPVGGLRGLFISSRSDITVEGIVFDCLNVTNAAAKIDAGSARVTLRDCEFKTVNETGVLGLNVQGVLISGDTTEDIILDGCVIHDVGGPLNNEYQHAIYAHCLSVEIRNCRIWNSSGHGIHLYGGLSNGTFIVENSLIYDCLHGIGLYYGTGIAKNNVIRNMTGVGLKLLDDPIDATAAFNTVDGCLVGAWIGKHGNDGAELNLVNNVFSNCGHIGIQHYDSLASGCVTLSDHNLIDAPVPSSQESDTPTGTNILGVFTPNTDDGLAGIKPTAGNPAIAAGVAVAGVMTDYGGNTRANPPTIGAWE